MKVDSWKKGFLLLLSVNILIILIFVITISLPVNDNKYYKQDEELSGYVPFLIHTQKDNLNQVINHYIKKEASGGPIDYQVVLGKEVELYGVIPIFSEEIQMKMTFEPKALENGDLILQQKSMSIGKMQLPVTYVLKFIKDRYKLPKGVIIEPNDKLVYISMQKLKLKSDFKVKVNEFDLKRDKISFQFFVPTK
ncbi:YpmS family protein [Neobacillus sp. D3-1R]|uniref:YpmS family protein n=1 Tax=Neobacillus sp. D3-1R TaxID=3445778 RepID=UPI003FA11400